jgi:hypothetical protein
MPRQDCDFSQFNADWGYTLNFSGWRPAFSWAMLQAAENTPPAPAALLLDAQRAPVVELGRLGKGEGPAAVQPAGQGGRSSRRPASWARGKVQPPSSQLGEGEGPAAVQPLGLFEVFATRASSLIGCVVL